MEKQFKILRLFCLIAVFGLFAMTELPGAEGNPKNEKQLGSSDNSKQIDSVLVAVNGMPITLLDVIIETAGEERELAGLFTGERLVTETQKLRREAVEKIILRKLVYKIYEEKPFPVPQQEIENMLDDISRDLADGTRPALEKKIREYGSDMEKLRARMKERLVTDAMLQQFCDRTVYVTPQAVYEEYQKNAAEWTIPEQIELQLLQLSRDNGGEGKDVKESVKSIQDQIKGIDAVGFKNLVEQNSDAANAADGGYTGLMGRDKLRPEFAEALKNAAVGTVVGPVETPEAFYFIRVTVLKPAAKVPFSKIRNEIHARLYRQALEAHRKEYAEKLRAKAVIHYYF